MNWDRSRYCVLCGYGHGAGMRRSVLLLLLAVLLIGAEVGPDGTVVVINGDSPASDGVARLWMRLRGIPEDHAVILRGLPAGHLIPLADFRERILGVIESELERRGLAERIALVAYAPDLPTAVAFTAAPDAPGGQRSPGSITGMTLLAPLLDGPPAGFTSLHANPYAGTCAFPGETLERAAAADPRCTAAERALVAQDRAEALRLYAAVVADVPAPSVRYNIACLRALAGDLPEAEAELGRAAAAGWMNPGHTVADGDLAALRNRPAWPGLLQRIAANQALIRPPDSERFVPLRRLPGMVADAAIPGRMAMVLANLGPRGLTRAEAETQLTASVAADGSAPTGTIWFMVSRDAARTDPRAWAFPVAALAIRTLGVAAEVREGILPPTEGMVAGATIGTAAFDWAAGGARMLPGAWCDHLTSFGGALQPGAGQTPCTAFLRAGAAGSGGAVDEPLNHPEKFPSAFVHLHRIRGLTLVEAVYRSVSCPYQYLAVGDPLSQPWSGRASP